MTMEQPSYTRKLACVLMRELAQAARGHVHDCVAGSIGPCHALTSGAAPVSAVTFIKTAAAAAAILAAA